VRNREKCGERERKKKGAIDIKRNKQMKKLKESEGQGEVWGERKKREL